MGPRRWVTCQGCGAPLPQPKWHARDLICPWCETPNTPPPVVARPSRARAIAFAVGVVAFFALALGRSWERPPTSRVQVRDAGRVVVDRPAISTDLAISASSQASEPLPPVAPREVLPSLPPQPEGPWERAHPSLVGPPVLSDPPPVPVRRGLPPPPVHARSRNVLVADTQGRRVVARCQAATERGHLVVLPDGQFAQTQVLVPTDAPFRALTNEQVRDDLLAGPFQGFHATLTRHYVVVSSGSSAYAEATARLLESLFLGLGAMLRRQGLEAHEAEFPLVAIIDRDQAEFRARRPVAPEVQAYYDPVSNRIYLYEVPVDGDETAPRPSRMVAHEGTHQVLQNNGVQPRLAPWPAWLSEGLAEYCAPTSTNPDGSWKGCGELHPEHVATLRDLDDPHTKALRASLPGASGTRAIGRPPIQELLTAEELRPTDYAAAWELTYYLAEKRPREFVGYLKTMGTMRPLEPPGETNHLGMFRSTFGPELNKVAARARGLVARGRGLFDQPYYGALFEQWREDGSLAREGLVSQSPLALAEWVNDQTDPFGAEPAIWVEVFPTRSSAQLWVRWWTGDEGR